MLFFGESMFSVQLAIRNIGEISNNQFTPLGSSFHPSSIPF